MVSPVKKGNEKSPKKPCSASPEKAQRANNHNDEDDVDESLFLSHAGVEICSKNVRKHIKKHVKNEPQIDVENRRKLP